MGLPLVGKKLAKKEKKSVIVNGKIGKKKEKNNKAVKGLEEMKNKMNKGKKKVVKVIKDEPADLGPSPNKKPKIVKNTLKSNNEGSTTSLSKLEKKKKVKKVKKAKNANQVPEAVTEVKSMTKPGKKSKKGKKAAVKEEEEGTKSIPEQKKKEKKTLTKEQAEKVLARRKEKHSEWENAINLILANKGVAKDEASLIRKSKKYSRHPLWKKNYIAWVKMDAEYKDAKHGPLIKKVYKILKGAERKAKRIKSKTAQRSTPQSAGTQAAIQRCVQLTSGEAKTPVVKKEAIKKEKAEEKVFVKQEKEGKKFQQKKEFNKSKKMADKKKVKSFKKMKQ